VTQIFSSPSTSNSLASFKTLVFAGGGNRCWWQAGVVKRLSEEGWTLPNSLIGTSAGAAVATACVIDNLDDALISCKRLYCANERVFHWREISRGRLHFAHQEIYPAWIASFLNDHSFELLRRCTRSLWVAISRPPKKFPLFVSIAAGTIAYVIDKKLLHSIHPRLPRSLGLQQEFLELTHCKDIAEARLLLQAAAAAPPFMSALRLNNQWAFDGGYTDNAPIPAQDVAEKLNTLVLLTRHYPGAPTRFEFAGRHYWQPSRKVPVSTWDCTTETTVDDAFLLGYEDADNLLSSGRVTIE
jgi:predicted acylesterase/phospholipase RssA